MISAENREKLVIKLIVLTKAGKLHWSYRANAPFGQFSAQEGGLDFEIFRHTDNWIAYRRSPELFPPPGIAIKVIDSDQGAEGLIDSFTDGDQLPILRDLYRLVEQNAGKVDLKTAKIEAFLNQEASHAQ